MLFFIFKDESILIDLGKNAFLRKLNDNFFALNINEQIISQIDGDEESKWWQLFILEKVDDKHFNLWNWTSELAKDSAMFYQHDGNFYFDSQWKSNDLLKKIKNGGFKEVSNFTKIE